MNTQYIYERCPKRYYCITSEGLGLELALFVTRWMGKIIKKIWIKYTVSNYVYENGKKWIFVHRNDVECMTRNHSRSHRKLKHNEKDEAILSATIYLL